MHINGNKRNKNVTGFALGQGGDNVRDEELAIREVLLGVADQDAQNVMKLSRSSRSRRLLQEHLERIKREVSGSMSQKRKAIEEVTLRVPSAQGKGGGSSFF